MAQSRYWELETPFRATTPRTVFTWYKKARVLQVSRRDPRSKDVRCAVTVGIDFADLEENPEAYAFLMEALGTVNVNPQD